MSSRFFQRPYPNANTILLDGPHPVLVDSGTAAGLPAMRDWLGAQGVAAERLALLVNTHWHSDHSGGNSAFQAVGVPIAAGALEAGPVNAGAVDACRAVWLRQAVAPYRVDRALAPGDVIETGAARWVVLALPGHTAGQVGFYDAAARVLLAGDAIHDHDVGWLDLAADPDALAKTEATIEQIAALSPSLVLSGHGPAVQDVPAALARARRRVTSWRAEPDRVAWHACKRIFAHMLIVEGGVARDRLGPALLGAPWFCDHARDAFRITPEAFVPLLVMEMARSGAAVWAGERLMPAV